MNTEATGKMKKFMEEKQPVRAGGNK